MQLKLFYELKARFWDLVEIWQLFSFSCICLVCFFKALYCIINRPKYLAKNLYQIRTKKESVPPARSYLVD